MGFWNQCADVIARTPAGGLFKSLDGYFAKKPVNFDGPYDGMNLLAEIGGTISKVPPVRVPATVRHALLKVTLGNNLPGYEYFYNDTGKEFGNLVRVSAGQFVFTERFSDYERKVFLITGGFVCTGGPQQKLCVVAPTIEYDGEWKMRINCISADGVFVDPNVGGGVLGYPHFLISRATN